IKGLVLPYLAAMVNVLIVHDIHLMCNIICSVLEDEPDITIVGCATGVEAALQLAQSEQIDVILISTRLPDQGALRLTQQITQTVPFVNVLVLGLSDCVEDVLQYVEAGAIGYVLKNDSVDDLLEIIRLAHCGKAQVSPEIAAALMSRVSELAQKFSTLNPNLLNTEQLTPREFEILELLGQNLTNQQISERLTIEVGTVKNHVHNILNKLDVNSRQEAALYLAILKK
ncbi:MAG: response regulator transcription factor, partial [Anaerolineaceae bacterium]|nr:response regulator transcription factor [Anaerolineaceae bacterium]